MCLLSSFSLFCDSLLWDSEAWAAPVPALLPVTQLYPEDTASPLSHQAELSRTAVWHSCSIFPGKAFCLHTPVPPHASLGSQHPKLESKT